MNVKNRNENPKIESFSTKLGVNKIAPEKLDANVGDTTWARLNNVSNDNSQAVQNGVKKFEFVSSKQPSNNVGVIAPDDIKKEIEDTLNSFKPISHKKILLKLLEKVVPVDFKAIVHHDYPKIKAEYLELQAKAKDNPYDENLSKKVEELQKEISKFKLNLKHYKIVCIEEILKLARQYHWGLCKRLGFIYLYNGAYWQLLNESELSTFLGKAAVKMGVPKWDAHDESFNAILLKQFLYKANLSEPQRDDSTTFINLKNGTFEISKDNRELRDFSPNDFITYQLPFDYDPDAKAPLFHKFLNRVLPDIERQNVLAEYLGYVFTRHLKLEKTLLLYGEGANGKSVFYEIVNAILGKENVSGYSLQSLTNESGYQRAKLANSLVNYASEINGKLETSIFKQLVSGEPVEARLPYCEPFTMDNYAKLIFNCNRLPRKVEHTNAYFRRFLIIPFDVTVPEEERDTELANKIIKSELSGVFNWILEGLDRILVQKKFTKCDAAQKKIEQYQKESDSVQMFLEEENYIASTTASIPLKDLFSKYRGYCLDSGLMSVSKRTFSQRLKKLKYGSKRLNIGMCIFIMKKE